jgi:Cysteine-rich CPCC
VASRGRIDDCPCESGVDRFACPCCGHLALQVTSGTAEHEICAVCFWQHDHVDEADPDAPPSGPNGVSLRQGRANFGELGACERRYARRVRPPRPGEARA